MPGTLIELATCPLGLLRAGDVAHPERALARGELVRVRRGVYADAAAWRALAPWDRYLGRVHAVALTEPDAVFCHESAAALLGMGVLGDPTVIHVLEPAEHASRLSGGIRRHTTETARDIAVVDGILVTSAGDTAVTLARHRHTAVGLAAACAALRLDPTLSPDQLRADNESRASSRGRRVARWVLDRATPLAESMLEAVSLAVIDWLGMPQPTMQETFLSADGTIDRGDFWWESLGLLGEVDGELKYDGRFGDPAELLRLRRHRDVRLRREHVRAVAHWGWSETAQVDPLRALLRSHGLRPERPENPAALHTASAACSPRPADRSRGATRETTTGRRGHA